MKKPSDIKGIFVTGNKTFYYLETGPVSVFNVIDRIHKTLLAKDILTQANSQEDISEVKYKIISLKEAQEKGYKVETLYATNHIKKTAETKIAPPAEAPIAWGKKK